MIQNPFLEIGLDVQGVRERVDVDLPRVADFIAAATATVPARMMRVVQSVGDKNQHDLAVDREAVQAGLPARFCQVELRNVVYGVKNRMRQVEPRQLEVGKRLLNLASKARRPFRTAAPGRRDEKPAPDEIVAEIGPLQLGQPERTLPVMTAKGCSYISIDSSLIGTNSRLV